GQAARGDGWDGSLVGADAPVFVSGIGSGTTYPDYKPAPFIVGSQVSGVDMVTVVTEGIFSYCSFKVKIDTDRYLGAEQANVRYKGEVVGHVTTAEYGSQMLSLGGVHHLTGGSKKEGRISCDAMQLLGNKQAVELAIDGGSQLVIQAGRAPVVHGVAERRTLVGRGTDILDPLAIIEGWDPELAWPGLRLLMVSTTGEHAAWFVLDEQLVPQAADMPGTVASTVARIGENCEPSLTSVAFLAGAGGSL